MDLAQLLVTPGTLLTAFIFFWKQAKAGRDELKRELKSDMNELKSDVKTSIAELKEEIVSVRSEVSSIREEMHDMNGRLGRVEGLLMAPEVGRSRQK